jgi:hypothetical protein
MSGNFLDRPLEPPLGGEEERAAERRWRRLFNQFALGSLWLAFLSFATANLTGTSFLVVLAVLSAGGLGAVLLAAVWMVTRAQKEVRGGTYGIATLLLVTLYAAMYLAAVRFVALAVTEHFGGPMIGTFVGAAISCLFAVLISLRFVIGLADTLIWIAVWAVKQPAIRRMLARHSPP